MIATERDFSRARVKKVPQLLKQGKFVRVDLVPTSYNLTEAGLRILREIFEANLKRRGWATFSPAGGAIRCPSKAVAEEVVNNLLNLLSNPTVKKPILGGDILSNILAVTPKEAEEAGFPRCVFCNLPLDGHLLVWIGPAAAWCETCGEDLARAHEERYGQQ